MYELFCVCTFAVNCHDFIQEINIKSILTTLFVFCIQFPIFSGTLTKKTTKSRNWSGFIN